LDSPGSRNGPVAGYCERFNSRSIKADNIFLSWIYVLSHFQSKGSFTEWPRNINQDNAKCWEIFMSQERSEHGAPVCVPTPYSYRPQYWFTLLTILLVPAAKDQPFLTGELQVRFFQHRYNRPVDCKYVSDKRTVSVRCNVAMNRCKKGNSRF
jgi:hypothetical protein